MVSMKWKLTPRLSQLAAVFIASTAWTAAQDSNPLKPYIKESSPVLVLEHVRVIDGTGAAPKDDQRIDIEGGKITRVEDANLKHPNPPNAKVLDLSGKTVIPGLVGMHEHLFYTTPKWAPGRLQLWGEMADSAPKLYLAGGVTTARTGGSMEPYTDLNLKAMIDAGRIPGPKLHITGPYLGGYLGRAPQMHTLTGPDDAARTVDYWAAEGHLLQSVHGHHVQRAEDRDRACSCQGIVSDRASLCCRIPRGSRPGNRQPGTRHRCGRGVLSREETRCLSGQRQ